MAAKLGPKGQVVIEKKIREQLGVEPGALAIQRLVGDHVEIRFAPPAHRQSLKGILRPLVSRSIPPEEWSGATENAWQEAAREREGRQ